MGIYHPVPEHRQRVGFELRAYTSRRSVALDFFTRIMHGVAAAFFEDVWARNFLNIFATPLSISQYLAGLVIPASRRASSD